ncbi:MAG: hypothetical protein ACR2O6_14615 [Ilumatobacteraceae bacterium]
MTAAHTSITGYTIIPSGQRAAQPTRRKVRGNYWQRLVDHHMTRRSIKQAWKVRRDAELAGTPATMGPRDTFTIRHADNELRRL